MTLNRRKFIAGSAVAGAGLIIGVRLTGNLLHGQESVRSKQKKVVDPFDAYVHVQPDGRISLIVAKSEMGQGIKTGLAMILAEEAEVDFNSVSVQQADTRPDIYEHMGTGGSGSTRQNYDSLRRAGATVRALMITAAAQKWNVPNKDCEAKKGTVLHGDSGRKVTYGDLVEAARKRLRKMPFQLKTT